MNTGNIINTGCWRGYRDLTSYVDANFTDKNCGPGVYLTESLNTAMLHSLKKKNSCFLIVKLKSNLIE